MGDILAEFMKTPRGKQAASEAMAWLSGPGDPPAWSGPPEGKKLGSWWADNFDKFTGKLSTTERKRLASDRDTLKMFLNDWESISRHSSAEFQQIDSIRGLFSSLQANLPPASLDDRAKFDGDAVNACRNAGYTVLLTLGAVYESQASGNPDPGDFGEKLAETKAAETCDRIYERVGEPDQAFQIGRNQTASEFWLTKAFGVVPKDVVTLVGEINDTFKAIEPDPKKPPSTSMTRTEALKTFSSQLDTLDAKTAEISPELRDVTGMLVVEAARKPLKILRENQPDVGFNRGLAPEEFKKLAERAREHQESRRPDDPRDRE